MKDGSVKITLCTQELTPHQLAELFLSVNQEIAAVDLPEDNMQKKTRSQRFRDVLYIYWKQKWKDKFETFELYYAHEMERITNHYKGKLLPED